MSEPGTLPEPPARSPANAVAGWYPDPDGSGQLRYWDGGQWTTHISPPLPGLSPGASQPPGWEQGPAAAPAYQSYQPYQAYAAYPASPVYQRRTNGMAIAALVVALAGFVTYGIGFVLGVIFGHVALSQIRASGDTQQGRGLAIAGLAIGYACIGIFVLIIFGALAVSSSGY